MFSLTCIKQAYKAMITQSIMFESKRRTYYNPHPFKARRLSFLKIFLVSLPLTKVGIHFGHVRMCATPCPISLIIFILDLGPSYTDKLLKFRWVQIAHLS